MALTIIHHNGAFNVYCSISDGPWFKSALTESQLREWHQGHFGSSVDIEPRLARASEKGTSSMVAKDLRDELCVNRAGPNESKVLYDEFIARFLTLPKECEQDG